MHKFIFFILFGVNVLSTKAQNQNSIWCFGDSAGINFADTSAPVPLFSGMDGRGSCVSIADSMGHLLFYAYSHANMIGNTGRILNKLSQLMEDGDSIVGQAWYQELVIVAMPASTRFYYLFSSGATTSGQVGLYYSIIDISANAGLGKVVLKNMKLDSQYPFDGISAVKHGNGRDWWVVMKLDGYFNGIANNDFNFYLITPSGISAPFIQSIGSTVENNAGHISFSKDGNKMALCSWNNLLEMFDFDRCTGQLSNTRIIEPEHSNTDGEMRSSAFSPTGKILYRVSNYSNPNSQKGYLIQYDLTATNISASKDTIAIFNKPTVPGFLRLGPDDKIYLSCDYECPSAICYPYPDSVRNNTNMNLSIINSPDSLGAKCNFQPFSFYLGGKRTYYGLPNNPDYEMGPWVGSICDTLTGIKELMSENLPLSVYPNPFYNKITLQPFYGSAERITINIFNSIGEVVYTKQSNLELQEIDLDGLAKGVYLLQVQSKKMSYSKKVVKL